MKTLSINNTRTVQRHEYHYNDFIVEARYLKEELIGRVDEIKTMKNWIKKVDAFNNELNCKFIYGGPGLGKSMIMASVASDLSNDKNSHLFYYRFRGGDARNNKTWFVRLLRDSLLSWDFKCIQNNEEVKKIINIDEMLKDINIRLMKIKEINPIPATQNQAVVRPVFRLLIDGLDEVLAEDPSMLTLIESLQMQGVVILIATRLENGAEELSNAFWSKPLIFKDGIDGLPSMSDYDIRAMLLAGISKAQRKELIKNDTENENKVTNSIVHGISKKADGLPLYIHLLLNDIQNSKYSIMDASKIPNGLNDYYMELVGRMGINDIDSYKAPVVTLLSLTSEPIDIEAIALTLEDIEDAKAIEPLIKDVLLTVGSLLKQVTTPENTLGYTLYHQSFKDFILKAKNNDKHPLYRTLIKIKKNLYTRSTQWQELPNSNFKNHLFRYGNHYSIDWQKNGLNIVKNRLVDLEYLLKRAESLPAAELTGLVKEYALVQSKISTDEQKEFYIWNSFFKEKLHLLQTIDEIFWRPQQTLFQLAYEDGVVNSPLTDQAEKLLQVGKINFTWLKSNNRKELFQRSGLLKVLEGHSDNIAGILLTPDNNIVSWSLDNIIRVWDINGTLINTIECHTDAIITPDGNILSWSGNILNLIDINGTLINTIECHTDAIITPDERKAIELLFYAYKLKDTNKLFSLVFNENILLININKGLLYEVFNYIKSLAQIKSIKTDYLKYKPLNIDKEQYFENLRYISYLLGSLDFEKQILLDWELFDDKNSNKSFNLYKYLSDLNFRIGNAKKAINYSNLAKKYVISDSDLLDLNLSLIRLYTFTGDIDNASSLINQIQNSNIENKLPLKKKAEYYQELSFPFHDTDNNKQFSILNKKAKDIYKELNSRYDYCIAGVNEGDGYWGSGILEKAKTTLEESLNKSLEWELDPAINISNICLANLLSSINNIDENLKLYTAGIELSKNIGHDWDEIYGSIYYNLAKAETLNINTSKELIKLSELALKKEYHYLHELARSYSLIVSIYCSKYIQLEKVNDLTINSAKIYHLVYDLFINKNKKNIDEIFKLLNIVDGIKGRPYIVYHILKEYTSFLNSEQKGILESFSHKCYLDSKLAKIYKKRIHENV